MIATNDAPLLDKLVSALGHLNMALCCRIPDREIIEDCERILEDAIMAYLDGLPDPLRSALVDAALTLYRSEPDLPQTLLDELMRVQLEPELKESKESLI